jgi:hypothetical protein
MEIEDGLVGPHVVQRHRPISGAREEDFAPPGAELESIHGAGMGFVGLQILLAVRDRAFVNAAFFGPGDIRPVVVRSKIETQSRGLSADPSFALRVWSKTVRGHHSLPHRLASIASGLTRGVPSSDSTGEHSRRWRSRSRSPLCLGPWRATSLA